jgi:hypothetical protein
VAAEFIPQLVIMDIGIRFRSALRQAHRTQALRELLYSVQPEAV